MSFVRRLFIVLLLAIPMAAGPVAAQENTVPTNKAGLPTLAPILEDVTPAVANIPVTTRSPMETNRLYNDPFFRQVF